MAATRLARSLLLFVLLFAITPAALLVRQRLAWILLGLGLSTAANAVPLSASARRLVAAIDSFDSDIVARAIVSRIAKERAALPFPYAKDFHQAQIQLNFYLKDADKIARAGFLNEPNVRSRSRLKSYLAVATLISGLDFNAFVDP